MYKTIYQIMPDCYIEQGKIPQWKSSLAQVPVVCSCSYLHVVVECEFVGMRPQADGIDLLGALVVNPRID